MDAKAVGKVPDWYVEYLGSDHWQQTRLRKLEAVGWRCEECGAYAKRTGRGVLGGLDIHHLTYARKGAELLDDLQALCFHCHAVAHGQPADDRSLARRREYLSGIEPDDLDLEVQAWDKLADEAGF